MAMDCLKHATQTVCPMNSKDIHAQHIQTHTYIRTVLSNVVRTDSKAIKLIVISLIHCNVAVRQFITIRPFFMYQIFERDAFVVCLKKFALRAFYVVYVFDFNVFIGHKYTRK